ncbi:ABC transporter permease [Mycoplasmopsis bovis]|uniref:ABC transporter permease n=1 Tax=Mycoplasmopsis bovis TaxID=28903 RepID=UPI003D8041FA
MSTSAFKYSKFAFNITFKKISTFILPILVLAFSLIIGLVYKFVVGQRYYDLAAYIFIFTNATATVIFSSIKALNIFKDFDSEGLEIITLSKPISRNNLILGKLLTLIYFGLIWSLVMLIASLFGLYAIFGVTKIFLVAILFLFVGLMTYLLFGLFTALICYKLSQKIAITIPIALFIPLALGGSLISANSTSNINNAAHFINRPYQYHASGNEANIEPYYLNNNKDELLLVPNGADNKGFSDEQIKYLQKVMNLSNNSSTEWQAYSWLSVPYQLIDIFNFKNKNVFETASVKKFSNLDNYVYHSGLDDVTYNYKLDTNVNLKKYITTDGSNSPKYIVPGALKSNSIFSDKTGDNGLFNYDIIYARAGAEDPNIEFLEDDANFSNEGANLVGRIKWRYIYEALKDEKFNSIAKNFVEKFNSKIVSQNNLVEINKLLMSEINSFINNDDIDNASEINKYENANVTIFDPNALKQKKLKSIFEKRIYFTVAFLNYIYFNYSETKIYEAMLKNPNTKESFGNYQYTVNILGHDYKIGGYSSFVENVTPVGNRDSEGKIRNPKIKIRYDLNKSDTNYLFQSADQVYAINRSSQIVNKNAYYPIWIILNTILFVSVFALYRKKEYK